MNEGRQSQRLRVFSGIVVLMFIALATRLWFLQVLAADRYRIEASQNSIREIEVGAPRGDILDRNGVELVKNVRRVQIVVNRQQSEADRATVVANLSELLEISPEALTSRIEDIRYYPYAPVPVAFDVEAPVVYAISEYPDDFPGVAHQEVSARIYPEGDIAAHLLGHMGVLIDTDATNPIFDDYAPDEATGRDGLEISYESDLRGEKGVTRKRVNAEGKVQGQALEVQKPVTGHDLVLTLDQKLQRQTETMLGNAIERVKGTSGAAVVLDAKSGGIVAIASYPTYSPTVWDKGINENERKELGLPKICYDGRGAAVACHPFSKREPKEPPLLNVATQGQYAPGSSIKPFVALGALRDGITSESEKIDCPPFWSPPTDQDFVIRNWDPRDLGRMDLRTAITLSCDTVFYELGQRYYDKYHKDWDPETGQAIVGVPYFQRSLEAFGFGGYTGVDLPTGQDGNIPDQEWKFETFYDMIPPHVTVANYHSSDWKCEYNWCPGDSVQMAIGQKDVLVTPLQLATAYGAIANDGIMCRPHLGLRIQDQLGRTVRTIKPECHRLQGFTKEQFDFVKEGLAGAVQSSRGTADAAFWGFPFNKVDVIGKTGTAEVFKEEDNAWFAAIAKGEIDGAPQTYVVTVFVERGGHGGTTSAPIARQIIEAAFGLDDSGFRLGEVSD